MTVWVDSILGDPGAVSGGGEKSSGREKNSGEEKSTRRIRAPGDKGCLPFVRINRLGRALNNGKGFSKISKPTERNGAYHLHFDFP